MEYGWTWIHCFSISINLIFISINYIKSGYVATVIWYCALKVKTLFNLQYNFGESSFLSVCGGLNEAFWLNSQKGSGTLRISSLSFLSGSTLCISSLSFSLSFQEFMVSLITAQNQTQCG